MALNPFYPHRCGRNYWDVWDWPQRVHNQHFGLDLKEVKKLDAEFLRQSTQRWGTSEVVNDDNKFEVKLDVNHFKPEDIVVKTVDNYIVISGKHEEKADKHGFIKREFTRRYALPERCDPSKVVSSLKADGILTIEAPKRPLIELKANERHIPINIK